MKGYNISFISLFIIILIYYPLAIGLAYVDGFDYNLSWDICYIGHVIMFGFLGLSPIILGFYFKGLIEEIDPGMLDRSWKKFYLIIFMMSSPHLYRAARSILLMIVLFEEIQASRIFYILDICISLFIMEMVPNSMNIFSLYNYSHSAEKSNKESDQSKIGFSSRDTDPLLRDVDKS